MFKFLVVIAAVVGVSLAAPSVNAQDDLAEAVILGGDVTAASLKQVLDIVPINAFSRAQLKLKSYADSIRTKSTTLEDAKNSFTLIQTKSYMDAVDEALYDPKSGVSGTDEDNVRLREAIRKEVAKAVDMAVVSGQNVLEKKIQEPDVFNVETVNNLKHELANAPGAESATLSNAIKEAKETLKAIDELGDSLNKLADEFDKLDDLFEQAEKEVAQAEATAAPETAVAA